MRVILLAILSLLLISAPAFPHSDTFRIADAAEEDTYGVTGSMFIDLNVYYDDSWDQLAFGYYSDWSTRFAGYWRWQIDIPKEATIYRANLMVFSLFDRFGPFDAAFGALAPDGKWEGSDGFSTVNYAVGTDLNGIPRLASSVAWDDVPDWFASLWYNGPDISSLVQARIDSDSYDPYDPGGNYFGLVLFHVSGDGFRSGMQEPTDDNYTARLYVEWGLPGEDYCAHADPVEICDDGIDNNCDGQIDEFCNECPEADAGMAPAAYVGDVVQLDGSACTDADGDTLTYAWSLVGTPEGSAAALSDPTSVMPHFTVDLAGEYTAELVVNDGTCENGPAFMSISTVNTCPTADAGQDVTMYVGDVATLDGAGDDIDGDALGFTWSLTQKPEGSAAELSDPTSPTPTFTIDESGEYAAELVVDDGECASVPDAVRISTYNVPPIAIAGADQETLERSIVQLDGSQSGDADGDTLSYFWSMLSRPSGSSAEISDPFAPAPTFYADVDGDYIVQLIVNDGEFDSEPDTCVVTALVPLCPKGKGYWKNHPDEWAVGQLEIGGEIYDAEELMSLLRMPVRGDASVILAGHLIAAKLNIAHGSHPAPIHDTIAAADALLGEYSGKLPHEVKPNKSAGRSMIEYADVLEAYCDGQLTLDCM